MKLQNPFHAVLAIAILATASEGKEAGSKVITFSEHIAPIVFDNCVSCHRPNEAAPFSLISYRDIQKRGQLIATVVEDHYMPPWHASSKDYEFEGHRALSEKEIELIGDWVDSGMVEGDPSKVPDLPRFTVGWQLGEPDLVVSMGEGYKLYAEGPDIYRNFVIPLNLKEDKWIKAIEFRPGEPTVVHHSLFYYDTSGEARRRDELDPVPGFRTMGGGAQREGSIGGWAVGGVPKKLPDGLAYRLPEGADLILSTHFHPSGKEETEISTVGFYFSEEPPEQRFTGLQLPPVFGALAGVDIPAGDSSYTIKDSFVLPVDVKAFGVSSHAHYLGKSMKMTATLPGGARKEMLSISDWDFSWQEQYRYKDYVFLPAGTRLDAEVVWDNSEDNIHNPNTPPKRVTWGRESDDEMGSVTLKMVAANPEEFPKLSADIRSHVAAAARKAGLRRLSGGRNRAQEPRGNRRGLRQRMLERFDGDGDGVLGPSEREAAREAFGR
jgi:hypothetical protein